MEIKLMDFKQPLENNVNLINKNGESKPNDFTSKLNKVNKKEKDSTNSKANEKIKEVKDAKDLEIIEESPKKDEKVLFQGMINLINIMPEIKEDTELEEIVLVANIIDSDINIEKGTLNNTENLMDEVVSNVVAEETDILVNHNLDHEKIELKEQVDIEQLKPVQIPVEQQKLEKTERLEVKEEPLIYEEVNLVENKNPIIKEDLGKFEDQRQNKGSKSEKKYELVEINTDEEGSIIEDKIFVPIVKDGVKFSVDKPIKVEVPLLIKPKEVIEQIVQKVKFDLSENKNEIKLSLKPEALGEMTMNIEVTKDGVIAKIMVDNYRAKEIIEGNLFQLKEGIKDTVLEIKTFEVFVGSGSDFDKHNSQQFNLKQNSKKIRIKREDNRRVEIYGEQLVDTNMNSMNIGLESSMNLQA